MNDDLDDKKLKELFQQMGSEDQGGAPPFVRMWRTAEREHKKSRLPVRKAQFAFAFAVLTVVVAGAIMLNYYRTGPLHQKTVTITEWRSPTHSLLKLTASKTLKQAVQTFGKHRFVAAWELNEPSMTAFLATPSWGMRFRSLRSSDIFSSLKKRQ